MDWIRWKHGLAGFADAYSVKIPQKFSPATDSCGHACHELILRVQREAEIHQDGVLGPVTARHVAPFLPLKGFRLKMVEICRDATSARGRAEWHYHQWRPYQRYWRLGQTFNGDCSGSSEMLCLMSGAADPSGWGFNGQGNTTSIGAHLHHIPRAWARPGDFALWDGHICVVIKPGPDPLLFSMGTDAGPWPIRASVEDRYHPGSPVYLQNVARA